MRRALTRVCKGIIHAYSYRHVPFPLPWAQAIRKIPSLRAGFPVPAGGERGSPPRGGTSKTICSVSNVSSISVQKALRTSTMEHCQYERNARGIRRGWQGNATYQHWKRQITIKKHRTSAYKAIPTRVLSQDEFLDFPGI